MEYIRHLEKTSPGVRALDMEGTVENFARGYQDYLQAPLQVCLSVFNLNQQEGANNMDICSP